jgi:hypothetical protein
LAKHTGIVELVNLNLGMATALNRIAAEKLSNPGYDIVVNMSFVHEPSEPIDWENLALRYLQRSGVVFVAAVGNNGGEVRYPAR